MAGTIRIGSIAQYKIGLGWADCKVIAGLGGGKYKVKNLKTGKTHIVGAGYLRESA